jgi:translation initiation factor 4E
MTVTFLTFNKSFGDTDNLVIPAEAPDIKSKLTFKWIFWVQVDPKKQDASDYKEATKQLASFDTIDSFWSTFSSVPQPSVIYQGERISFEDSQVTSMMLFRDGVKPEWEDPVNAEGGHFQFQWKPSGLDPKQLDEYWNNLVLAVIGDTVESEGEFSDSPIIQGIRFVDKMSAPGKQAGVRIEVWFSKPLDARHLQRVRSRMEKAMALHIDGSMGTVPRCDVRYHCNRH